LEEAQKNMWDMTVRELFDGCKTGLAPENGMMVSRLMKGGTEPVGALIFVVGQQETLDVIGAVDQQLTIWQSGAGSKRYLDEKDRIVFVASIRGTFLFGAFASDPLTGHIEMLPGKNVPTGMRHAEAQKSLDAFAKKKGWIEVPDAKTVLDMLSLAMIDPPETEVIDAWTDSDRIQAARWAGAVHLQASDNQVRIPPVPNVLFSFIQRRK